MHCLQLITDEFVSPAKFDQQRHLIY